MTERLALCNRELQQPGGGGGRLEGWTVNAAGGRGVDRRAVANARVTKHTKHVRCCVFQAWLVD